MRCFRVFFLLVIAATTNTAFALKAIEGKVTAVEPTYMPGAVTFTMDTGDATCNAGKWLRWQKADENNKVVYSTLMAALMSGRRIRFLYNDGDASCVGQYLHLLSN